MVRRDRYLVTEGFWVSQTWGFTWKAGKGNGMLKPEGWVAKSRSIGVTGKLWGQMNGGNEGNRGSHFG